MKTKKKVNRRKKSKLKALNSPCSFFLPYFLQLSLVFFPDSEDSKMLRIISSVLVLSALVASSPVSSTPSTSSASSTSTSTTSAAAKTPAAVAVTSTYVPISAAQAAKNLNAAIAALIVQKAIYQVLNNPIKPVIPVVTPGSNTYSDGGTTNVQFNCVNSGQFAVRNSFPLLFEC